MHPRSKSDRGDCGITTGLGRRTAIQVVSVKGRRGTCVEGMMIFMKLCSMSEGARLQAIDILTATASVLVPNCIRGRLFTKFMLAV